MMRFVLLQLFLLSLSKGAQLVVTPGRTIAATGSQLDPDGDLWWVDKNNQLSFRTLSSLLTGPCEPNATETRFRYFNNSGQVYVRMTPNWIYTEFWYPFVFWSGYATTAQILENGANNLCYQCISEAGYASPEAYDFQERRENSPDDNCWDECIGDNTFLNTGDTDQDPIFSWAFFESKILRDTSLTSQPPQEYRLPNNVDLQVTHTFNRSMELVTVSNALVYSFLNGQLFPIGTREITYVHGSWFRSWTNPSGNQWISPYISTGPKRNTCFTWIASKDDVTGKFGTLNAQYYVEKAGIVCPNITTCERLTTASPTRRPTLPPTRQVLTAAPTPRQLPIINFTGTPCQTCSMDLFVIVDASKSISDESFQVQKLWVQQLFRRIRKEYDRMNAQMAALGFSDRVCFRAGIVTFSYLISMPMNISMWNCNTGGYDITIGNQIISSIGRPHTPITRFSGTHIRDALDGALLMYNTSNKTCTSFYGIALTDGLPQSYRQGPDTNQNPCIGGYRGTKFQNKLTNFFWVPVEGQAPFNPELFTCLLKPPTQNIITQSRVISLMNWNRTAHPECQMCQTKPPTKLPTKPPTKKPTSPPTKKPTRPPTNPPTKRPTSPPTKRPTSPPTRKPTNPPTKRPTSPPTKKPTNSPTKRPTSPPTKRPTSPPTRKPTSPPTKRPTSPPTRKPTNPPTKRPTSPPTKKPTSPPTKRPTKKPTSPPTKRPTSPPTRKPTNPPTKRPTSPPTRKPTNPPTKRPTSPPTKKPTSPPTKRPTNPPTKKPTSPPTKKPTAPPTKKPTTPPTKRPTRPPTNPPTKRPTSPPTKRPTSPPTKRPTSPPTKKPTSPPTRRPTKKPTSPPTKKPTGPPTRRPTSPPTRKPTNPPTKRPTGLPTKKPTAPPTKKPTRNPTNPPTRRPTSPPTKRPTGPPTKRPTSPPTKRPTSPPTKRPTNPPTKRPTSPPTKKPTSPPTKRPTNPPTKKPTSPPTKRPTGLPTKKPTSLPTKRPTKRPTSPPTKKPTNPPTKRPTTPPTKKPTRNPTNPPTRRPTSPPTRKPTNPPTKRPTGPPTKRPTSPPTKKPTSPPTKRPTGLPTKKPTAPPTKRPTGPPTKRPTNPPTKRPTSPPTKKPTRKPTNPPTRRPTSPPTKRPTGPPTKRPTSPPTKKPTSPPTKKPTRKPTNPPTRRPTTPPTKKPTYPPTKKPTKKPTLPPTKKPTTSYPTKKPTCFPTKKPTLPPTKRPTARPTTGIPTKKPTRKPSVPPTQRPTTPQPTNRPTTRTPTNMPTRKPTNKPSKLPTSRPTVNPTKKPTSRPTTRQPTSRPTLAPTVCIPPPHESNCSCGKDTAEWQLELIDYDYSSYSDRTTVKYEVCVNARNPYGSCNKQSLPVSLGKLFLQMPCNCELCVDGATDSLSPSGSATEIHRGWVWFVEVQPGHCQTFELILKGHTTLKSSFYQLIGDDERCVDDTILVPDICESIRPTPRPTSRQWKWPSTNGDSSEDGSSGDSNSGDGNSGDSNSGDGSSGDGNSGDGNSGDGNSGDGNSGDGNSGDSNSGDGSSGDSNSGDSNSGDGNSGDGNSGDGNSGDGNSGDSNSGDGSSGDGSSGDGNSGDSNSGDGSSGDGNSGDGNSGDGNSGDGNSGDGNSGDGNSGDSGDGNSGDESSGDGNSGDGSSDGNSGEENNCQDREGLFLKDMCWTKCDSVSKTEWSIQFKSRSYDAVAKTSTFTWLVNTSSSLPPSYCGKSSSPSRLSSVVIRLGCDCEVQSSTFLSSITQSTSPTAVVAADYWRFNNLYISAGKSAVLTIVLKGDIAAKANGDATLGGSYRCVSTSSDSLALSVPNPCGNPCNYGQWTNWKLQGECSAQCGGGDQTRVRSCVSVCDPTVTVDNCLGESISTVPCNTQPCSSGGWWSKGH